MAVDYLKTYLGIDPDDYSAMEARIRGEEPQAQVPLHATTHDDASTQKLVRH